MPISGVGNDENAGRDFSTEVSLAAQPEPDDLARLRRMAIAERDLADAAIERKTPRVMVGLFDAAIAELEQLGNLGSREANAAAWQWLEDLERRRLAAIQKLPARERKRRLGACHC